jgi:hypothetical protein
MNRQTGLPIMDYETGVGMPGAERPGAIQSGLEWPGVILVEEIGYGPGVMLRK